jgi:hypothetical protein
MSKRKEATPPPLSGVVYVYGTSVFSSANVGAVVACVAKTPKKEALWIAEALNDATTAYFSAFALSKMGPPSEQVAWARKLSIVTNTCLRMLVPSIPVGERPRVADHRVLSVLFHHGGAAHDALDKIVGDLWDLKRLADHAEEQWRLAMLPRTRRRQSDKEILSWVSHLADIYWRVFRTAPHLLKAKSPFARFADAARKIALNAMVTAHGTDDDARKRLEKLTPARLASFAREHAPALNKRLAKARKDDYTPERIALGMVSDAYPFVGNQPTNKI